MSYYRHKKLRPLHLLAMGIRGIAGLLHLWPLLLVVGFILSPITPYMRWTYTYEQRGIHKQYIACEYLGMHGFIRHVEVYGTCPFVVMMDRRLKS